MVNAEALIREKTLLYWITLSKHCPHYLRSKLSVIIQEIDFILTFA